MCLKISFTFTNSVDPDEMQHYASLFAILLFRGFPNSKDWETYQIQQILEKKKSLEYAMNNQDVVHILKVNEYDLEKPQSNTAE